MSAPEMSAAEAEVVARFDAAEPAPESWRGDELRVAATRAVYYAAPIDEPYAREIADAVLTLPEVAALRAKAAAADRVRELHWPRDRGTGPQCQGCATNVTFTPWPCPTIAALDGPPKC